MERKSVYIIKRNENGDLPRSYDVKLDASGKLPDICEEVVPTHVVVRRLGTFSYEATIYNENGHTTLHARRLNTLGEKIKQNTAGVKAVSVHAREAKISRRQKNSLFEATSRKKSGTSNIRGERPHAKESPHVTVLSRLPIRVE